MLLALLAACRRDQGADEPAVAYDSLGLPDCGASYTDVQICDALTAWTSSVADGFAEDGWFRAPRWIGTEDGYFCADDAAGAEAFVVERVQAGEGWTYATDTSDPRWFDLWWRDADGAFAELDRVTRCDFYADLAETPPGTESVADFATYAATPVAEDDFFPVMREIVRWRGDRVTVQAILSWGEATTESLHLATCGVRCGVCEDPGGGPYRAVTGVLERLDFTVDPDVGRVEFEATEVAETECTVRY